MATHPNPLTTAQPAGPSLEDELNELFSRFHPDREFLEAQEFIEEALRYAKPQALPEFEVEVSAIGTEDDADKK